MSAVVPDDEDCLRGIPNYETTSVKALVHEDSSSLTVQALRFILKGAHTSLVSSKPY